MRSIQQMGTAGKTSRHPAEGARMRQARRQVCGESNVDLAATISIVIPWIFGINRILIDLRLVSSQPISHSRGTTLATWHSLVVISWPNIMPHSNERRLGGVTRTAVPANWEPGITATRLLTASAKYARPGRG
jgi:hypothetical protein